MVAFVFLAVAPGRTDEAWKTILDGKSLNGWRVIGDTSQVAEMDDAIRLGWKGGLVYNGEKLNDFEMRAQLKTRNDVNSGIWLHTPAEGPEPRRNWEVQIANSKTADKFAFTGAICLITSEQTQPPVRDGEWFELAIRVEGARITTQVNGKVIEDADHRGKSHRGAGTGIFFLPTPAPRWERALHPEGGNSAHCRCRPRGISLDDPEG